MDSKKARELIDVEKLKQQLLDVASQVKEGETEHVPFPYMYGDPVEFEISRQDGKLTIEPNFAALTMSELAILEEPVRQVIDNILKNQKPVFEGSTPEKSSQVGSQKGLLAKHGMFAIHTKKPSELTKKDTPKPKIK